MERQESRQQNRRPQQGNPQGWDFNAPPQQYQQPASRYGKEFGVRKFVNRIRTTTITSAPGEWRQEENWYNEQS